MKRPIRDAVLSLLADPKAKGLPKLQLARLLVKNRPDLFATVDQARTAVRFYTGSTGNEHRSQCEVKDHFGEPGVPHDPWADLPPALKEFEWKPVEVKCNKTAVIADLHMLYYDPLSLIPALQDIEAYEPDCIIVLGDLLDFYEISVFNRDPSIRNGREVLLAGFKFWQMIRRRFPKTKLVWKYGNHEERWEHYCWRKSPEFCDMIPEVRNLDWIMNHPSLFSDLDDRVAEGIDIEVVRHPVPIKISRLYLLHGHEIRNGTVSPVNAARGAFLKTAECVMVAHQHQSSSHREITLAGRLVSAWSLPCLCNLHPRYSPVNPRWSHGHAFVDRVDEDNFQVTQRQIVKGKVY